MYSDRMDLIQVLRKDLCEPVTEAMIRYWDLTSKENNERLFNSHFSTLATKKELGDTKKELSDTRKELGDTRKELGEFKYEFVQFRGEVKEEFATVRGEMKEGFAKVKGDLEVKISDTKSDIARWMFALFVTMLLAILGLYLKK